MCRSLSLSLKSKSHNEKYGLHKVSEKGSKLWCHKNVTHSGSGRLSLAPFQSFQYIYLCVFVFPSISQSSKQFSVSFFYRGKVLMHFQRQLPANRLEQAEQTCQRKSITRPNFTKKLNCAIQLLHMTFFIEFKFNENTVSMFLRFLVCSFRNFLKKEPHCRRVSIKSVDGTQLIEVFQMKTKCK